MTTAPQDASAREVFVVALRLGLTSFGGPIAHLGYFRETYVARLRWLSESEYADLLALCQVLPGPTSSQVGMAVGLRRAGLAGMAAAWLGFTLPSAALLVGFASGLRLWVGAAPTAWLHGLLTAAAAVVAQALVAMARAHVLGAAMPCVIAVAACALALAVPTSAAQVAAIAAAGAIGAWALADGCAASPALMHPRGSARAGAAYLGGFATLLAAAFALPSSLAGHALALAASFFRAGSLVFGGGHVVLALLQGAVVAPGWVAPDDFVAGYGAAQAVPGPLFTFAAYLGAAMIPPPNGVAGAALCLVAIFLPSFLLVAGLLPFWDRLRGLPGASGGLRGINAAVVGLLGATFVTPVVTSAVHGPGDLALAAAAYAALVVWRVPAWLVVVASAAAGALVAAVTR